MDIQLPCLGALEAWPGALTGLHVLARSLGSAYSYCTASEQVCLKWLGQWPLFFLELLKTHTEKTLAGADGFPTLDP